MLSGAGIRIDGDHLWDVRVRNRDLFDRILSRGTLGVGESYMDGWWECESIDEMVCRIWRSDVPRHLHMVRLWPSLLIAALVNRQRGGRAFEVGHRHYDLGNDLYERMLDRRLIYSCGYWKQATTLDEAQEAKLDLIARKLELQPGMRVLDIGCGWGGTLAYMREHYGVAGVGITISKEQAQYAQERYGCHGLAFQVQDYRSLDARFDRIFSVGMFEHVGVRNYREYFKVVRRCLADDGLFLLQTIGGNESSAKLDPWVERYIFPNSMLPSARQITRAAERVMVFEDWHSFGTDYDRTLLSWNQNFSRAWPELSDRYDERFYRMWRYYLLSSAGTFRARVNQLWQIVFSPNGVQRRYAPEHIR